MKKSRRFKDVGLAILLLLFLTSCGGSSGGSSSGISYTGLTTQATVDQNNAEELSTGAYSGGSTGSAIGGTLGVIQTGQPEPEGYPRVLKVAQVLEGTLDKVDFMSRAYGTFVGEVYTESEKIYGACGGSASVTVSIDDQTGYFSGRMNFNKYCDMEITISGGVDLSGKFDLYAEELTEFTMSFDNLTSTSASDSVTLKGDISLVNVTAYGGTMIMNMTMQDNSTKETFRLVDYKIVVTEQFDSIGIDISGRYYDPNYGYVDISTPTLFRIYEGNENPSKGVLVVTGKTGIGGGSTKARLKTISSSTYKVEADTDGDGLYDYDTGVLYWLHY
jgi:hypothetical protein